MNSVLWPQTGSSVCPLGHGSCKCMDRTGVLPWEIMGTGSPAVLGALGNLLWAMSHLFRGHFEGGKIIIIIIIK